MAFSLLRLGLLTCVAYFSLMSLAHWTGHKAPGLFVYWNVPSYEYQDKIIAFCAATYAVFFFHAANNPEAVPAALLSLALTARAFATLVAGRKPTLTTHQQGHCLSPRTQPRARAAPARSWGSPASTPPRTCGRPSARRAAPRPTGGSPAALRCWGSSWGFSTGRRSGAPRRGGWRGRGSEREKVFGWVRAALASAAGGTSCGCRATTTVRCALQVGNQLSKQQVAGCRSPTETAYKAGAPEAAGITIAYHVCSSSESVVPCLCFLGGGPSLLTSGSASLRCAAPRTRDPPHAMLPAPAGSGPALPDCLLCFTGTSRR